MEFLAATIVAALMIYRGWKRSGMRWVEFLICRGAFVYARFWHRCSWRPWGRFPGKGPALVICNHTSSADPTLLLGSSVRGLSFVVAREHFNVHPVCHFILKYLDCVAVKRGGADPIALRRALQRLDQGYLLAMFPEGGLSGVARNRVLRGKPGMAFLALSRDVPVYPVYIANGTRTDELLKSWVMPSKKSTQVYFGKPIDLTAYRDKPRTRAVIEEVTEYLMKQIAALDPKRKQPEEDAMNAADLVRKKCAPCEGKVAKLTAAQAQPLLAAVPLWQTTTDGQRLRREWRVKDFVTALDFFNKIGAIAEAEDHHPDLHLVGYRNVTIEIWTHAVGGLTENDFILAAKIDEIPVEVKSK